MASIANTEVTISDAEGSAPTAGQKKVGDSPSAMTKSNTHGPLTEFTLFPKLPIELRIIIWGLAAPQPAYVTQVMSKGIKRRLHYIHTVPAILHVCQESRNEFLAEPPKNQATQPQKRGHPVYTFYSTGGRTRNEEGRGFYMSAEIDTFWGLEREDIRKVSIARELKHLAVRYRWMALDRHYFKQLHARLPALETLTILLPISKMVSTHYYPKYKLEPEIGGELNPSTFDQTNQGLNYIHNVRGNAMDNLEELKKNVPDLKVPIIKWRFEEQAIEAENIVFPKAPENPYEEIDREEAAIEKQRELQRKKVKRDKKRQAVLSESNDI